MLLKKNWLILLEKMLNQKLYKPCLVQQKMLLILELLRLIIIKALQPQFEGGKNPFEIYSENKKATEENIIDIIEKRQTGKEDLPKIPIKNKMIWQSLLNTKKNPIISISVNIDRTSHS
jgi:hypothetical protein